MAAVVVCRMTISTAYILSGSTDRSVICGKDLFFVFVSIKHLRQLKDGGFGTGENEKQ